MTTNPSTGDTVIPTKTSTTTQPGVGVPGNIESLFARAESTPAARKRHLESSSPKTEVPRKSPRRSEPASPDQKLEERETGSTTAMCVVSNPGRGAPEVPRDKEDTVERGRRREETNKSRLHVERRETKSQIVGSSVLRTPKRSSDQDVREGGKSLRKICTEPEVDVLQKTQLPPQPPVRNEAVKLRKTIQWLEEGARRMREDLAATRAELHEERRAARLARKELDAAVKDAKIGEAARHLHLISELKSRLAQSPTRSAPEGTSTSSKAEFLRGENHRRELSALRNRLAEAEATVQKLKANANGPHGSGKRRRVEGTDGRRLEVEVQALRAANKKLEERIQVVTEAERKRAAELRIQHENHEAQLATLQKTLRSDTIKMMDEIRSKTREIEKLERLVIEGSQMHRKLQTKEDDLMRKLRETERSHQIRLAPRIEDKISTSTEHVEDSCNGDCDAAGEVERLRELSVEQQEVIEVLRQAVKEKERKLEQISNKKRKEEFYKQWLELEPVVEVEDEDEHEEGDSALSSAPSSLSPQPGGCGQWQHTGITREAYETVLIEVEELQTRLVEEQRELAHAKSQVRDLEKALLQETRGSQNSRRALSDKLREMEDREATLIAEISELREQNELLEFRVLELEETPCLRDTPDPADSGIVSPEPIHLYKDQLMKQRDRAVATVIPYNTYNSPASPIPQKPPLSLQESGIFEEDDETDVELASRGTQTETPAGDLLQEVQRLHELRARIQERAVKVPVPLIDTKLMYGSAPDVTELAETTQISSYHERIRHLEQRLADHEEAENKRLQDKQLSKQREEELLDENYRLTERIYWFENVLRNSKNSEMKTEDPEEIAEDVDCCRECGKTGSEVVGRLEELVQVELQTRQRIVDLERREATYMKTLQKADETWVETERGYSVQLEELGAKLELEQSTNEKLARRAAELEEKLEELERRDVLEVPDEDLEETAKSSACSEVCEEKVQNYDSGNQHTEASEEVDIAQQIECTDVEAEAEDVVDGPQLSRSLVDLTTDVNETMKMDIGEIGAELATEAKEEYVPEKSSKSINAQDILPGIEEVEELAEEMEERQAPGKDEDDIDVVDVGESEAEPLVTINETEPEKKIIYFRWR